VGALGYIIYKNALANFDYLQKFSTFNQLNPHGSAIFVLTLSVHCSIAAYKALHFLASTLLGRRKKVKACEI
jgi:hypothetical protein